MSMFALLPPEIISGWLYSGTGPGTFIEASTAWDNLANELAHAAVSTQTVVKNLDSVWTGSGATAAAASIEPHIHWLESASVYAHDMGMRAKLAATLFEAAHAATVPPPVIAANRSLLLSLIATNFFGQNTPAIMATEAHYEMMWAQDGAMMTAYEAGSHAIHHVLPAPVPAHMPEGYITVPHLDPSGVMTGIHSGAHVVAADAHYGAHGIDHISAYATDHMGTAANQAVTAAHHAETQGITTVHHADVHTVVQHDIAHHEVVQHDVTHHVDAAIQHSLDGFATTAATHASVTHVADAANTAATSTAAHSAATAPESGISKLAGDLMPHMNSAELKQELIQYGPMFVRYVTYLRYLSYLRYLNMATRGASAAAARAAAAAAPQFNPGTLLSQVNDAVSGQLKHAVGVLMGHFSSATNALSAKLGHAASMGGMRVPGSWATAADGMLRAAPVLPHTTMAYPSAQLASAPAAPSAPSGSLPGGPLGNALMGALAGRGVSSILSKKASKKVIPRSPSAG